MHVTNVKQGTSVRKHRFTIIYMLDRFKISFANQLFKKNKNNQHFHSTWHFIKPLFDTITLNSLYGAVKHPPPPKPQFTGEWTLGARALSDMPKASQVEDSLRRSPTWSPGISGDSVGGSKEWGLKWAESSLWIIGNRVWRGAQGSHSLKKGSCAGPPPGPLDTSLYSFSPPEAPRSSNLIPFRWWWQILLTRASHWPSSRSFKASTQPVPWILFQKFVRRQTIS